MKSAVCFNTKLSLCNSFCQLNGIANVMLWMCSGYMLSRMFVLQLQACLYIHLLVDGEIPFFIKIHYLWADLFVSYFKRISLLIIFNGLVVENINDETTSFVEETQFSVNWNFWTLWIENFEALMNNNHK